jgi:hypothetical protein
MAGITEQMTFDALRRAPYYQACVEYTMACIHLPSDVSEEVLKEYAEPELKKIGWTHEELILESRRRSWMGIE